MHTDYRHTHTHTHPKCWMRETWELQNINIQKDTIEQTRNAFLLVTFPFAWHPTNSFQSAGGLILRGDAKEPNEWNCEKQKHKMLMNEYVQRLKDRRRWRRRAIREKNKRTRKYENELHLYTSCVCVCVCLVMEHRVEY